MTEQLIVTSDIRLWVDNRAKSEWVEIPSNSDPSRTVQAVHILFMSSADFEKFRYDLIEAQKRDAAILSLIINGTKNRG